MLLSNVGVTFSKFQIILRLISCHLQFVNVFLQNVYFMNASSFSILFPAMQGIEDGLVESSHSVSSLFKERPVVLNAARRKEKELVEKEVNNQYKYRTEP